VPSDDSSSSLSRTQQQQVRRLVREETDAALRHQRTTLLGGLAVFTGLWSVLALGFLYLGAVVIPFGVFVGLLGLVTVRGQRPFGERRRDHVETVSGRD
jgi:predicted lipid-binding transport protein (Tim44 family)